MILIQYTIQFSDTGLNQIISCEDESSSLWRCPKFNTLQQIKPLTEKGIMPHIKVTLPQSLMRIITAKSNSHWVCMNFILPLWTTLNKNSKFCDSLGYYWTLKWKTQDKFRKSHFESCWCILLNVQLKRKPSLY